MGTGVRNRIRAEAPEGGNAEPNENDHRGHEHPDARELHHRNVDLLPEVFGRAAHHEACNENCDDNKDHHSVKARADPAEDHFAEEHQKHRHKAADRREGVMHVVDGAAGG